MITEKEYRPRLNQDEMDVLDLYREGLLDPNNEQAEYSEKLQSRLQKGMDLRRIEKASFRNVARLSNALEVYNQELIAVFKEGSKKLITKKHKVVEGSPVMILQLSDLHLNEIVNIKSNKYDFYVASQRLKMLADETISMGHHYKSKKLVIAVLGDLLNSDRRIDELLSMATNRAKATQLSILLLKQFLLHLNEYFNITLSGVTGNESRAKQEMGFGEILATDNYDFTIYDSLRLMLGDKKGFTFNMMVANEAMLEVYGKNFLLMHGHQLGQSGDIQKKVQQVMGRFNKYGVQIHFVLAGHIHNSYVSDYFSRNASLVGSNSYSEEALNYVSWASQTLHVVKPNGAINSTRIDLQDAYDYDMYPMEEHITAYNAKSSNKAKPEHVIIKVVV